MVGAPGARQRWVGAASGIASPTVLPHGRSPGHGQGRWVGRASIGSLCRAQSPGRCGLCVWGCPDPVPFTPHPHHSHSGARSVNGCPDRQGPARPRVTARSAQARNPEPPGWFDGQHGPGGKCCSHFTDEKTEARRADWLPGAQAARNRTPVRLGASCSPHPASDALGALSAISQGRSEAPCLSVVTNRGEGSDARAELC